MTEFPRQLGVAQRAKYIREGKSLAGVAEPPPHHHAGAPKQRHHASEDAAPSTQSGNPKE